MRRVLWLLRIVVALSVAGATAIIYTTVTSRPASADSSLLGWTAQADANTVDIVIDNASGLSGFHPLAEIDLPESNSNFESGPFGYGLASVFWPGAIAGNLGSLSGELPLPSQLAPLFGRLNDPVRAESFYPSGPADATYPAGNPSGVAEMKSHAGADGIWAQAGVSDVAEAGFFSLQGVRGSTTASASNTARATASGSLSGMTVLGLIDVGASSSSVEATSDGVSPSGTGATHVGAVTIMGHSVSFGSDGIVVGPAVGTGLAGLVAPPVAVVNQLIGLIHLKIVALPQTEVSKAPAEKITSGGLQISFSLPADLNVSLDCSALNSLGPFAQLGVLCTLPGLLQGATVTMTLDRVTAEAIATPPFSVSVPGRGVPPSPQSPPAAEGPGAGTASSAGGSGLVETPQPSSGGSPSLATTTGRPGSPSSTVATPGPANLAGVALSKPVQSGLLVFLLAVAALAGAGLVRMSRTIDRPLTNFCPLEDPS